MNSSLKVLNSKLESARDDELPLIASNLRQILSVADLTQIDPTSNRPANSNAKKGTKTSLNEQVSAEKNAALRELRAHLTRLIGEQSTPQGRWVGVLLIHEYVLAQGWAAVEPCPIWVRFLMSMLQKTNPWSTRTLAVITLANIFRLSENHAQFVRATVTPVLPTFVRLGIAFLRQVLVRAPSKTESTFIEALLSAFIDLIPSHPTIFRPFHKELDGTLREFLFSSHNGLPVRFRLSVSAHKTSMLLLAELSRTGPKTSSSEIWTRMVADTIQAAQFTLDCIFESTLQSADFVYESEQGSNRSLPDHRQPQYGYPGWSGSLAGVTRARSLLELISTFLSCSTSLPVPVPIGQISGLLSRVLDIRVSLSGETPTSNAARAEMIEFAQIHVPLLYASALDTSSTVASVLGFSAAPILIHLARFIPSLFTSSVIVTQPSAGASSEHSAYPPAASNPAVRQSVYQFLQVSVQSLGPAGCTALSVPTGLDSTSNTILTPAIQACYRDLLAFYSSANKLQESIRPMAAANPASKLSAPTFSEAFKVGSQSSSTAGVPPTRDLVNSALDLLPVLYTIPEYTVEASVRALMDRTTVLIQHEDSFLASALFPNAPLSAGARSLTGQGGTGADRSTTPLILCMAPRNGQGGALPLTLDGLIHPRFPAIRATAQTRLHGCSNENFDAQGDELRPSSTMNGAHLASSTSSSLSSADRQTIEATIRQLGQLLGSGGGHDTPLSVFSDQKVAIQSAGLATGISTHQSEHRSIEQSRGAPNVGQPPVENVPLNGASKPTVAPIDNLSATQPNGAAAGSGGSEGGDSDVEMDDNNEVAAPAIVANSIPTEPLHPDNRLERIKEEEDDDDDDFEIPSLVMESDSD